MLKLGSLYEEMSYDPLIDDKIAQKIAEKLNLPTPKTLAWGIRIFHRLEGTKTYMFSGRCN